MTKKLSNTEKRSCVSSACGHLWDDAFILSTSANSLERLNRHVGIQSDPALVESKRLWRMSVSPRLVRGEIKFATRSTRGNALTSGKNQGPIIGNNVRAGGYVSVCMPALHYVIRSIRERRHLIIPLISISHVNACKPQKKTYKLKWTWLSLRLQHDAWYTHAPQKIICYWKNDINPGQRS